MFLLLSVVLCGKELQIPATWEEKQFYLNVEDRNSTYESIQFNPIWLNKNVNSIH